MQCKISVRCTFKLCPHKQAVYSIYCNTFIVCSPLHVLPYFALVTARYKQALQKLSNLFPWQCTYTWQFLTFTMIVLTLRLPSNTIEMIRLINSYRYDTAVSFITFYCSLFITFYCSLFIPFHCSSCYHIFHCSLCCNISLHIMNGLPTQLQSPPSPLCSVIKFFPSREVCFPEIPLFAGEIGKIKKMK